MVHYSITDDNKECLSCKRTFKRNSDFFLNNKRYKDGLESRCKECRGRKFTNKAHIKNGYKVCSRCKEELPANTDHFTSSKRHSYKVGPTCKVCLGGKYTKWLALTVKQGYKYCSNCENQKPATDCYFFNDKYAKDGLYSICKECKLKKTKEFFNENEGYREEYDRKYYLKNKEYYKIQHRKFIRNNVGYSALSSQKRLAKINGLLNTLMLDDWNKAKKHFGFKCAYCGMDESENALKFGRGLEQEHVIPLSKGGPFTVDNIIPACRSCNSSKRDKGMGTWFRKQDFYTKKREEKILAYIQLPRNG